MLQHMGFSLRWILLWNTGSRHADSVVVAHGLSCSTTCGIFPDQGSNPYPRIGRWTLIHCTAGEVQRCVFKGSSWPQWVEMALVWGTPVLYALGLPAGPGEGEGW